MESIETIRTPQEREAEMGKFNADSASPRKESKA